MHEIEEVFRNHNRNWMLGYYMYLHLPTPTMDELFALRYGSNIAKANNFHHIHIETDSIVLLYLLENDHLSYHNILTECRSLMEEVHTTTPTKIYREQNAVADALAKEGAKS